MKKALFTLLLFCLGFFISACGGGGRGNSSGYTIIPIATDPEAQKTITLSKTAFCINKWKTENITVYYDGKDITKEAIFTFVSENVQKSTVAKIENGVITALNSVTINGNNLKSIGSQAFYYCGRYTSNLTLTIPDNVTSIGINALYNVKFYYNGTATGSPWGGTKLTN